MIESLLRNLLAVGLFFVGYAVMTVGWDASEVLATGVGVVGAMVFCTGSGPR